MTPIFWTTFFLGASAFLCAGTSISYLCSGRPGMALAFCCFAVGNLGYIWDTLTVVK